MRWLWRERGSVWEVVSVSSGEGKYMVLVYVV